jgi:hypothetical protein
MTLSRRKSAWLWLVQALLALVFGYVGATKLAMPFSALATRFPQVSDLPEALIRFIGAAEVLGALGLILPGLTRVRPALTAHAAAGLALVMALAALFHVWRGEFSVVPVPVVLGGLATFVAWSRRSVRGG